jgi:hypothetical protein
MSKILIVGGLGYLGIEVASQLESEQKEYSVLDNKMMKGYSYPDFINVYEQNYINCENSLLEDYDTILYCSDIDVESFYSSGEFNGYIFNYTAKVHEHVKKFPKKNFYYVYSNTGKEHGIFLDDLFRVKDDYKNFIPVYCPVLYGISDRSRNDTLINNIISDFMIYKQYIIEVHPFTIYEFESITNYARSLVGLIVDGKEMFGEYDRLPVLNIASLIQWEFGPDCSIGHDVEDLHVEITNSTVQYEDADSLSAEISRIIKAIEKKMNLTFLTDSSNNKKIIDSTITSKNFTKRLVE